MFDIFNSFDVEGFKDTKPLNNAVFANGIYQKRKAFIGTFITEQSKGEFDKFGLTQKCENSFTPDPNLPRIPGGLLSSIVTFYKEVYKKYSSEVYCAIVWDIEKQDYFVHVPVQTVSAATISYTNTPEIYSNPNYQVIMDLHSHGSMSAFFSSVDLADELESRYFAVIGEINKDTPKMVLRAATNGVGINQDIFTVFDSDVAGLHADSDYTIDLVNIDNITERVFKATLPATTYSSHYKDSDWDYPGTTSDVKNKKKDTRSTYSATAPFTRLYTDLTALRYARSYDPSTVRAFFIDAVKCIEQYYEDLAPTEKERDEDLDLFFLTLNTHLDQMPDVLSNDEDNIVNFQTEDNLDDDHNTTSPTVA